MRETYVTGASGFIGSNLVKRLGSVTAIPHQDIATTKIKPFDYFYFLSAYGNMADQTDDNMTIQANVGDLCHVLSQIDPHQEPGKLLFMSTSSVRLRTQTMYSRTKKAAEEILLAYREKYDLPILIIRPFSVTGVGEQEKHLIPTLIRSCYTGELVNFVPDPVHDFIDVSDVVEGIMTLLRYRARGIYELGSGKQYSNLGVLKLVEKITGKKANVNLVDQMRVYDTKADWVSMNYKARGFGWMPKKTLEQSIAEMVGAYENAS